MSRSIAWHPEDPNALLTAGADPVVHLRDIRNPNTPLFSFRLSFIVLAFEYAFC